MTRSKDRTVENAWRLTLGLVVFAIACCGVVMVYHAFFAAITAHFIAAALYLILASAIAWSIVWICTHRNDLAGEG